VSVSECVSVCVSVCVCVGGWWCACVCVRRVDVREWSEVTASCSNHGRERLRSGTEILPHPTNSTLAVINKSSSDLIPASVYDKYSVGLSIRPICTR